MRQDRESLPKADYLPGFVSSGSIFGMEQRHWSGFSFTSSTTLSTVADISSKTVTLADSSILKCTLSLGGKWTDEKFCKYECLLKLLTLIKRQRQGKDHVFALAPCALLHVGTGDFAVGKWGFCLCFRCVLQLFRIDSLTAAL